MSETIESVSNRYTEEIDKAWAAYQNNESNKAEAICTSLISEFPDKFGTYYLLGHIYFEEDKLQKALEQYSISLEKDTEKKGAGHINYWIGQVYDKYYLHLLDEKNPLYNRELARKYYEQAKKCDTYPSDVIHRIYYTHQNDYDSLKLYSEAIEKFPDQATFYILTARMYKKLNNKPKELEIYNQAIAKGLKTSSLYYNVGDLYLDKKQTTKSRDFFLEALKLNEHYPQSNYAINYAIGNSFYEEQNFSSAEIYYRNSFQNSSTENTCWFGCLGLIEVYAQQGKVLDAQNLINEIMLDQTTFSFEGMITGGPFWLDSNITESISLSIDSKKIVKSLNSFNFSDKSDIFQGKIWLIKALLADYQNNDLSRFTSLKNALKYLPLYKYDFLESAMCLAYSSIIHQKTEKNQDIKDIVKSFKEDLKNYSNSFKTTSAGEALETVINALYEAKLYKEITEIYGLYTIEQIASSNILFEIGYSLNEEQDYLGAKKVYEKYIELKTPSSAVLNNLGNIYDREGNLSKAIELYRNGLKLEPEDKILKNNLARVLNKYEAKENEQNQRKASDLLFKSALKTLKQENNFVLEKLNKFLVNIKIDEKFDNWVVPIQGYKFPILMGTDKQKAESLKIQWLNKNYIQESDRRDEHRVIIYFINPYLEAEITRINNNKIPDNWLKGFDNISIGKLEEISYFDLTTKIQKVNKKFKPLLERDFNELVFNYLVQNEKATIVLSGSLVELILTYHFEKKKINQITYTDARGNIRSKNLYDCVLNDLITYAEHHNFYGSDFPHLGNLSRIYRNFIHPGRELKDKLDKSKCDLCFISTTEILKKIL